MEYANLSPESKQKLSDFFKEYFASDYYKDSQTYLREVVRKNEQARYNLSVPQPTQEK